MVAWIHKVWEAWETMQVSMHINWPEQMTVPREKKSKCEKMVLTSHYQMHFPWMPWQRGCGRSWAGWLGRFGMPSHQWMCTRSGHGQRLAPGSSWIWTWRWPLLAGTCAWSSMPPPTAMQGGSIATTTHSAQSAERQAPPSSWIILYVWHTESK